VPLLFGFSSSSLGSRPRGPRGPELHVSAASRPLAVLRLARDSPRPPPRRRRHARSSSSTSSRTARGRAGRPYGRRVGLVCRTDPPRRLPGPRRSTCATAPRPSSARSSPPAVVRSWRSSRREPSLHLAAALRRRGGGRLARRAARAGELLAPLGLRRLRLFYMAVPPRARWKRDAASQAGRRPRSLGQLLLVGVALEPALTASAGPLLGSSPS
jgi:hypothetical protein